MAVLPRSTPGGLPGSGRSRVRSAWACWLNVSGAIPSWLSGLRV